VRTLWGQVEMEGVECFRIAASLPQAASQELQWVLGELVFFLETTATDLQGLGGIKQHNTVTSTGGGLW
jgi:hypothetical protein